MRYIVRDWRYNDEGYEELTVAFVGRNKDELIDYLLRRIGDLDLEVKK